MGERKRALGLTAADCVAALRDRYPTRSHALLEEVANSTGFSAKRWADVVTLSLWPSRGIFFSGFEIKVSKGDFAREMADPAKSAEVQAFCSEWWIVAPQGLLEAHEMPPTWGLLEVTDKLKCKVAKAAPQLEAKPVSINFVAALLRRASESSEAVAKREFARGREDGAANGQGEIARRLKLAQDQITELHKMIDEFAKASGVNIRRESWALGDVGAAVKAIRESRTDVVARDFRLIAERYRYTAETLEKSAQDLDDLLGRKGEAAE